MLSMSTTRLSFWLPPGDGELFCRPITGVEIDGGLWMVVFANGTGEQSTTGVADLPPVRILDGLGGDFRKGTVLGDEGESGWVCVGVVR